jgi:hypothetical protein
MANNWCYPRPHRGDPTSSSFISESRLGSFHHPPPQSKLALSRLGPPDRDSLGMMHETTRLGLAPGEHLLLSGPYGEVRLPMLALTRQW